MLIIKKVDIALKDNHEAGFKRKKKKKKLRTEKQKDIFETEKLLLSFFFFYLSEIRDHCYTLGTSLKTRVRDTISSPFFFFFD